MNSFRACGISMGGSENDLIHCTKPGQVTESAAPVLPTEDRDCEDSFFRCG